VSLAVISLKNAAICCVINLSIVDMDNVFP
jgi:hypothetical protein